MKDIDKLSNNFSEKLFKQVGKNVKKSRKEKRYHNLNLRMQ